MRCTSSRNPQKHTSPRRLPNKLQKFAAVAEGCTSLQHMHWQQQEGTRTMAPDCSACGGEWAAGGGSRVGGAPPESPNAMAPNWREHL
eukprot:1799116-Rhodomonas_salina.1